MSLTMSSANAMPFNIYSGEICCGGINTRIGSTLIVYYTVLELLAIAFGRSYLITQSTGSEIIYINCALLFSIIQVILAGCFISGINKNSQLRVRMLPFVCWMGLKAAMVLIVMVCFIFGKEVTEITKQKFDPTHISIVYTVLSFYFAFVIYTYYCNVRKQNTPIVTEA